MEVGGQASPSPLQISGKKKDASKKSELGRVVMITFVTILLVIGVTALYGYFHGYDRLPLIRAYFMVDEGEVELSNTYTDGRNSGEGVAGGLGDGDLPGDESVDGAGENTQGADYVEATPFIYDWVGEFHEGLAVIGIGNEEDGRRFGVIDKYGTDIIEPRYDLIRDYSGGDGYYQQ